MAIFIILQLASCIDEMDPTRRKGVHIEVEFVRPLPEFDTGVRPKLKCTAPGIRGRIYWVMMHSETLNLTNLRFF